MIVTMKATALNLSMRLLSNFGVEGQRLRWDIVPYSIERRRPLSEAADHGSLFVHFHFCESLAEISTLKAFYLALACIPRNDARSLIGLWQSGQPPGGAVGMCSVRILKCDWTLPT
jgi:hypothetical protein